MAPRTAATYRTRVLAPRAGGAFARAMINVACALVVALGASAAIHFYLRTHRLIGVVFAVQQISVASLCLFRRPAAAVSRDPLDWIMAIGGTFAGFLMLPVGTHPAWGVPLGLGLQLAGLAAWAVTFAVLGRSFGLVAADRGLVTRGPYALVRHPLYTTFLIAQLGYLVQSV